MTPSVRVGQFHTDLRFRFRHASADRSATENVIVEVTGADGVCGYGEGCPRDYVTGETVATAQAFLRKHGPDIADSVASVADLQRWIDDHEALIDANPAAFAAIELAMLDLLGRRSGEPLEGLIEAPTLAAPIRYSAIIGDASPRKTRLIAGAHRLLGFKDYKIKLNGDLDTDRRRLRALPRSARLRADANNLWPDAEACIAHARALDQPFWAIEEPVAAGDIEAMRTIAKDLDVNIILDESLSRQGQLDSYAADADRWIANVRVSKCGGVLRAVRLARHAQSLGLGVILGAHVGETSLLTRAALAVGQALETPPLAREGAYGTILLRSDISRQSLKLGRGGRLLPGSFAFAEAPGTGLAIDPDRLDC
ncbi:MAG: enolase C-terminal domain-like protein [Pseudomonadota bacterium]